MNSIAFLVSLLVGTFSQAQTIDGLMSPNDIVTRKAKLEVRESLIQLQDSLKLSKKEIKIRRFKLKPCNQLAQYAAKNGLFADASTFLKENNCIGIYSFAHRTNRNGSHYYMNYYFDQDGELVDQEVNWIMVIH